MSYCFKLNRVLRIKDFILGFTACYKSRLGNHENEGRVNHVLYNSFKQFRVRYMQGYPQRRLETRQLLWQSQIKIKSSALKGVFAKNERGYRLNAIKKRFWSPLILLLSVASIWRKLLKNVSYRRTKRPYKLRKLEHTTWIVKKSS